jgi:hypothetical protein
MTFRHMELIKTYAYFVSLLYLEFELIRLLFILLDNIIIPDFLDAAIT